MQPMLMQINTANSGNNGAMAAGILVGVCVGLAIGVAIAALFCYFITRSLETVPPEYRKISTGQVWLLLIPLFSAFWNFIVFQRVPESFKAYFDATGRSIPNEDYGKQLGLIYSILSAIVLVNAFIHIPFVGGLVGLAAFVLLIILIVKFNKFRTQILQATGSGFPVTPVQPPPQQ